MNLIGKCVVAGNVRRTAEIALGFNDEEYLNLKNYKLNPHREQYGWTSNNTIFADLGMDYKPICERIIDNGEPGLFWLQNARDYSRIRNGKDKKDHRVSGVNPCCFAKSSEVLVKTNNGLKEIKDITNKDKVWLELHDKMTENSGYFSAGIKDIYKVRFENNTEFFITLNHKLAKYSSEVETHFDLTELKDL